MHHIEIASGRISGLIRDGVTEYRGIPFAAPPTGERRFLAPQPVTPWAGVRQADRFAAAAWQMPNPLMGTETISDDCLYANVWVPEGDGPFPVMVWIHGGAYTSGSPSQLLYSGRRLAERQRVIVVNLAYRLGAWGFGWFAEQAPDLPQDGNRGLRDQVAGLRWVSDNIAAFGGDPARVTVFGESAGGFSVASLMACPYASGLFQSAIVQSGAADFVLSPGEADKVAAVVVEQLPGAGSPAQRLASVTADELVAAQLRAARTVVKRGCRDSTPQFGMTFMPVVDGDWLPDVPVNCIAAGSAAGVRLMAGVCQDEWHLFQYAPPFNGGVSLDRLRAVTEADITKRFARNVPFQAERALALYRDEVQVDARRGLLDLASALETDRTFTIPTLRLLDAQASATADVWGFRFDHRIEAFGVPLGACHVTDVPLVFDLADTPVGQVFVGGQPDAVQLAAEVSGIWGRFAHGESPAWPCWSDGRQARTLSVAGGIGPLVGAAREALWADIIPQVESGGDA